VTHGGNPILGNSSTAVTFECQISEPHFPTTWVTPDQITIFEISQLDLVLVTFFIWLAYNSLVVNKSLHYTRWGIETESENRSRSCGKLLLPITNVTSRRPLRSSGSPIYIYKGLRVRVISGSHCFANNLSSYGSN